MIITDHCGFVEAVGFGDINLDLTLDCGQAFRWQRLPDGKWSGIADGKGCTVEYTGSALRFYGTDKETVESFWLDYFDLNKDYEKIIATFKSDPTVYAAVKKYGIVHILNQPPWETLCSFIISACNNIPRIKSIVSCLCREFGSALECGGFSFPTPDILAEKSSADLSVLHAGYRDEYIIDAAKKVYSGEINFNEIKTLDINEARKRLMTIKGVGKKVADCTLLFSLGFTDCFPVDRHIQRGLQLFYPDGLPECFTPNRGLAQQYIFHAMHMGEQNGLL